MVFYIFDSTGIRKLERPTLNLLDNTEIGGKKGKLIKGDISEITRGKCMVRIHSNGCGHCLNMESAYHGLNSHPIRDHMDILDIEVGSGDYRNHASEWVRETMNKPVPHIFVMDNGKVLDEYSGDRSTKDMISFMKRHSTHGKTGSRKSSKLKHLPSSIAIHLKRSKRKRKGKKTKSIVKSKRMRKRRKVTFND
jgi:hypothetical protein